VSRRAGDPRIVPGLHPVRELLRAQVPVERLEVASSRGGSEVLDEILGLARQAGVLVEKVDRRQLDRLGGGVAHQGVVAVAAPYEYADLDVVLAGSELPLVVALDGVTDPQNLGSIARTAEAVGADGLVLPARRSAGVSPAAEKAAAGALAHLPVVRVTNLVRTLGELGVRGVWAVGLDGDGPVGIADCHLLAEPLVLVVGAEGRGVGRLTAEACDELVRLPTRGRVGSLNASVAAAVALYEVLRERS